MTKLTKLEQSEYESWIFQYYYRHYKYGYLLYLILNCVYIIQDHNTNPNVILYSIILRIFISVPVLAIPILLKKDIYKKYFKYINVAVCMLIPMALATNIHFLQIDDIQISLIYLTSLMVQIIAAGLFIMKWQLNAITLIVLNLFLISLNYSNLTGLDTEYAVNTNLLFIMISLVSIFITYHLQSIKTRMFVAEKSLLDGQKIISKQNDDLELVNNTKNKLFSIISHDLRNPIGNYMNVSRLLYNDYYNITREERLNFLRLLKDSSENIYLLLDNLLSWSKSQQGLITVNIEKVSLSHIVSNILDILNSQSFQKQIKVNNHITNGTIINSDPKIISIILQNIITNAIKFTPENGVIAIDEFQDNEFVTIAISDNGIGMNQDIMDSLFVIGSSINRQGTNKEPSSGLGLIISKEFIEKLGGSLVVESEEEKGSTFFVNIPKDSHIKIRNN